MKKDEEKTVYILKSKEKFIIYYEGSKEFNLGDQVDVKGNLEEINNNSIFNLFNYRNYMLSKKIYYSMRTSDIELLEKNKNIFYKTKTILVKRISKLRKQEYLKTFILGDSSDIVDKELESYRINGISHLFSVSGMHITLLSTLILFILNSIKKSYKNNIFVIVFLLFYLFLTNFTPSVIRATLLFIFMLLNRLLKLNISTFKVLLIILCINLIINPFNIYNVGFKFSYVVSLFLIFFSKAINKYNNYILKIFITSFISFLAGLPIMINNYYSINIMSILNNIIFVPLVSVIIFPFSIIVLFVNRLDIVYEVIINVLENLSLFVCKFKIEIILAKTNIFIIIVYYIIIIFTLYKVFRGKKLYIIIIIVVLFVHGNINYFKNDSFITFLDVGQGDCIHIHLSHNKGDILIDTGGTHNYSRYKNIINYLKSEGIRTINYLVLSHGDFDHMGEAINLVNNFKVEKVIFNCGEFNDLEKELIKVLDKNKILYYSCIKELKIDNNKLYFLQTDLYDNENDNSNVIYTEINGYKFMFMGDAGVDKEKDILNKYNISNIDVLKVGHHGSKTSSSKEFINDMNPKYSVISVGKNNRYGHPNKEVLNVLEDSKIYITDQDGSIMFKIKNNKLNIRTCGP